SGTCDGAAVRPVRASVRSNACTNAGYDGWPTDLLQTGSMKPRPETRRMTMRKSIVLALLGLTLASVGAFADKAGDEACKFSDMNKVNAHLDKHVTYPMKGKEIKAQCQKEMPDEFTKEERACVARKLKDDQEYKNADAVRRALGLIK